MKQKPLLAHAQRLEAFREQMFDALQAVKHDPQLYGATYDNWLRRYVELAFDGHFSPCACPHIGFLRRVVNFFRTAKH